MAKKRNKKKKSGHYCWCCASYKANEKFSGGGHARHLCNDCRRLSPEELAYRQGVRDIERMLNLDGRVRRKLRPLFARQFLAHPNERIRLYAEEVHNRPPPPRLIDDDGEAWMDEYCEALEGCDFIDAWWRTRDELASFDPEDPILVASWDDCMTDSLIVDNVADTL